MLDLMNPVSAFGRLVGEAWELWRDEAKAGNAGHTCYLAGLHRELGVSGLRSQNCHGHDQARADGALRLRAVSKPRLLTRNRSRLIQVGADRSFLPTNGTSVYGGATSTSGLRT